MEEPDPPEWNDQLAGRRLVEHERIFVQAMDVRVGVVEPGVAADGACAPPLNAIAFAGKKDT